MRVTAPVKVTNHKIIGIFLLFLCIVLLTQTDTPGYQEKLKSSIGLAVYYADKYDGNRTASGATFDNDEYVAAHPSYPLGTIVKVTNLKNKRSVNVKIVDRGISKKNRKDGIIIDLSQEAAKALDFISDGKVKVKVDVLKWGEKN
jgi:rare lipoprotein A